MLLSPTSSWRISEKLRGLKLLSAKDRELSLKLLELSLKPREPSLKLLEPDEIKPGTCSLADSSANEANEDICELGIAVLGEPGSNKRDDIFSGDAAENGDISECA